MDEELTEELLERLLATASPEAYLAANTTDDRTLGTYIMGLVESHGLKRSQVARAAAVNGTHFYQICNDERKVGRDNAIKIALGIGCTLRETQRLLRHAKVSELWCKDRRDAIIIYCIEHGYSRAETDDELYRLGEPTLMPAE